MIKLAELLDKVGQEDDDINNDGKVDKTDKYLLKRRKAIATNLKENDTPKHKIIAQLMGPDFFLSKKPESSWDDKDHDLFNRITKMAQETGKVPKLKENQDHEVSMAQASLKSIIKSAAQLMLKLGNMERDIPGWIQDHITNAENYIDQASQGFHELNEGPQIGKLPVRIYKLVQGKETELSKIKNPKVIDYIKKNSENINIEDLAKLLSVREQVALQYINALKTLGALVSKNPTTSKPMSSNDVDDLFN